MPGYNFIALILGLAALASSAIGIFANDNIHSSVDNKILVNTNNFELHSSCLAELQKQMNLEKNASLVYKQMAAYFGNVNVAKRGFAKMFDGQAKEETEHFDKILNYLNLRGAYISEFNISMPRKARWATTLEALKDAIELEHFVTDEIIRIHRIAEKTCKDIHLMNFLENDFIDEQISSINKLMKLSTILKSAGPNGYGEYIVDRDLLEGKLSLETL